MRGCQTVVRADIVCGRPGRLRDAARGCSRFGTTAFLRAGPMVRIRVSPAGSLVRPSKSASSGEPGGIPRYLFYRPVRITVLAGVPIGADRDPTRKGICERVQNFEPVYGAVRPSGSAGVSKAAFRPDCQPRGRDQSVQLRVWTEPTRPARARGR